MGYTGATRAQTRKSRTLRMPYSTSLLEARKPNARAMELDHEAVSSVVVLRYRQLLCRAG